MSGGERPVDIRNLAIGTSVDLEERKGRQSINQNVGATVELPIPDNLYTMLVQQEEDVGVPNHT